MKWERWFAWHPVEVDGRRVWLEFVERHFVGPVGYLCSWHEYRMPA